MPDELEVGRADAPTPIHDEAHRPGAALRLLRNLLEGLRALLFLTPRRAHLAVDAGQFVALALLLLAVNLALDFVFIGADGEFNVAALPLALFPVPVLLLAGYVAATITGERGLTLVLPLLALAMSVWFAVFAAVDLLPEHWLAAVDEVTGGWLDRALRLWWLAAMVIAVVRLGGAVWTRRARAAAVFAILAGIPLALPHSSGTLLWTPSGVETDDEPVAIEAQPLTEGAFYAQQELLQRRVAALASSSPGKTQLYFVGVGGDGTEDVFRNEIDVITKLFAERFGTAQRSLALINSPRTLLDNPIATRTNLARALSGVSAKMNVEKDVLFLYITTHGSADHRLALLLPPLELSDLAPRELRAMLDASGARWRVIVISACYSGGFIEALQDERSLIVTASDADHVSFGCGSESNFTYFGKAYFDEALRSTTSFTDAFALARARIAAREQQEGLDASNPQMVVGARIAEKLREFTREP